MGDLNKNNLLNHMAMMRDKISNFLNKPRLIAEPIGETEDPHAHGLLWIASWVDYADKYGIGFLLCDMSASVSFNDNTKLTQFANHQDLQYINKDSSVNYYKVGKSVPSALTKKMKLLDHFQNYMMTSNFVMAGGIRETREGEERARMPYLSHWYRSRNMKCVIFLLSDGTLQMNFKSNGNKLVFYPLMEAVVHITRDNLPHFYYFSNLESQGCSEELYNSLQMALVKIKAIMDIHAPAN